MTSRHAQLGAIRTFPSLVKYLRDEMGWPIGGDSFEDLTFDYSAEELGIDAKNAAKIEEIKRLRPLASGQPWGIFFVKFEPKRLPVVALRRILSQVVLKKRATAKAAELAAWAADDLLFVSNYGEGDARHISFAHFSTTEGGADLPTLKVLGWDSLDTPLHRDDVAERLTRDLAWPEDDDDAKAWRKAWRAAFTLGHREVITTSRDLSVRLAELARAIRDRIGAALAIENAKGPLTMLMTAFQSTLVHDLDAAGFADMYAQTIAYGLLSSRIADPKARTADDFAAHMRTNPFLRELMQTFLHVGGRRGKAGGPGIDFDELGVSEVIDLLDRANMEAVMRDFGDRNPEEDPVIHFYELFLKEYDAKKRMQRGVFYTPRPVVSFIVRSVDEMLRIEFGLTDGLADITSWAEMTKRRPGMIVPDGIAPEQSFVQILDPATGTGTFLVEAIGVIHQTMVAKWKAAGQRDAQIMGLWNEYVPTHLLPRLHGYELLMAPYAIAHLKVGLKLYETGYRFGSYERARIFLTNALEPPSNMDQQKLAGILPALAHEAQAVDAIKQTQRFTVVMGNPPYAGNSSNRGQWIEGLINTYRRVDGQPLGEVKVWLKDDYVKFIRFSEWALDCSRQGVMGLITNNSYFDGLTFRGMRQHILVGAMSCRFINLHGNGNLRERALDGSVDENVFDILQGVGVTLIAKADGADGVMKAYAADIFGKRSEKYGLMLNRERIIDKLAAIDPTSPYYFVSPQSEVGRSEYEGFESLTRLFEVGGLGFQSHRDSFVVAHSSEELTARMNIFFDPARKEDAVKKELQIDDYRQFKIGKYRREHAFDANRIIDVQYRPFDYRKVYYAKDIVQEWQIRFHGHMLQDNIGLNIMRQTKSPEWRHVMVSRTPTPAVFVEIKDGSSQFPLYRYGRHDPALLIADNSRVPNFNERVIRPWLERLGVAPSWTPPPCEDLLTVSPEDIFHYIYGILYSAEYRGRYEQYLKVGFPRVPLTGSLRIFREIAELGEALVNVHLLGHSLTQLALTTFIGPDKPEVGRVGWANDGVWLDAPNVKAMHPTKPGTIGFLGVQERVWNFHIGGYQVCEKWLKDRKGRTLSAEDIVHYQEIIGALSETIRLMGEIDATIEEHGGWPGAFVATEAEA